MDIEKDVFPFLRDNNLTIETDPPQNWENQNRPPPPPRTDYWMIDSNQILPPAWSNRYPESHPLGGHGEDFPKHGEPELATVELFENGNGDGFLLPSNEELDTDWLQKQVEESGIEALAWYRPYHLNQGRWGITITDRGIWYIAQYLVKEMYSEPYSAEQIQECFDIATEFLYHHEMFHFKVEFTATVMELNASKPAKVYARYWDNHSGGLWFGSPSTSLSGEAPLEEALANEYARQKICRAWGPRIRSAIEKFMTTQQPSGYNDVLSVSYRDDWLNGLEELSNMLLGHKTPFGKASFHIDRHFLDADEAVPCQILDTGLPFKLQVRASLVNIICKTRKFVKTLKAVKKNSVSAYKDFEESLNEPLTSPKRKIGPTHNIQKNRKVSHYRVRGKGKQESYRVYIELIDGDSVFRAITSKYKQTQTIQSLKDSKNPEIIHKFGCTSS